MKKMIKKSVIRPGKAAGHFLIEVQLFSKTLFYSREKVKENIDE